LNVLRRNSLIKFIDRSTNLEEKSISFNPNSLTFDVQLREGNWIIQVEVINDDYYYKNDPYYYFPIIRCHESKDYWLDLPIRKTYFNGTNMSSGSKRIVFRIKARFDIFIKKVYNAVTWKRTCSSDMGYGWGNGSVTNIKISQGNCIAVIGYIPINDTSDRSSEGEARSVMDWVSIEYDSLTVYNGCEVNGYNNVITHTDNYVFYKKTWWDCVSGVRPGIELWEDRVINDSWPGKY
jgi:hypothetical protein